MFGEANFTSNRQSLSAGEGEALGEEPLKACRKHHVGKAAFLPPISDGRTPLELESIQCSNPAGPVLQEVTGVQSAPLRFPARCFILQNSFY